MENIKDKLTKRAAGEHEPLVFSNARKVAEHTKLPLWRKLGFAVGSMPYSMCATVMGFYLTIFLLEVALLDPTYVLVLVFTGRVWDGITDPIVGFLSGRTKTRLGQFRPWLLLSAIPAAVGYFLLWFVPDFQSELKFVYYFVAYLLMETLLTCVHVPFTSLTVHLSYNQKETDSVTMFRIIFEIVGTLVGIGVFTAFYVTMVDEEDICVDNMRIINKTNSKVEAYRYHSIAIGVMMVLFLMITFMTVREQKEEISRKNKISFWQSMKETFGFKPYRELILLEMFSWLGVQFIQANFTFYAKYSLSLTKEYPYVVITMLFCSILWMPVWQIILVKVGKKTAFFLGMMGITPILISLLYVNYMPQLIYPLAMLGGSGVAVSYLIPWSMVPDVIDAAYLKTGVRREELFYASFVFGIKFSAGITLGLSTGIYKLVGYDQDLCEQPWSVPLMFKIIVSAPPVVLILISLIFLWRYPINSKVREEMNKQLKKRRCKPPLVDNYNIDAHITMPGVDFAIRERHSDYNSSDSTLPSSQSYTSEEATLHGKLACSTSRM